MANPTKIMFTPPMEAHFTCLNTMDRNVQKDGSVKEQYQVKLRAPADRPDIVKFMAAQKAVAKELGFAKVTALTELPMKHILDDEGEKTGTVQIILKSKFKPLFVQKSGKPYVAEPNVGDTSILVGKIKCGLFDKGVSSVMEAVQVIERKEAQGGKASADGFQSFGDGDDEDDAGAGFQAQDDAEDVEDDGGDLKI